MAQDDMVLTKDQWLRRINYGWISEALGLYKQNIGVWIVASILVIFISAIVEKAWLVSYVTDAFFSASMYRMANKQVRGVPIFYGDIFGGRPAFWRMLGFSIISGAFGSLLVSS